MGMLVKGDDEQDQVSRTVSFQEESDDSSRQSSAPSGDTNFQLAGVTLDAGVKIYCSRVDSVHINAFKVLGGLSRTGAQDEAGADDGGADETAEESETQGRRRRARRAGKSTIETNMSNITSQKLETDLAVDPLFQKMSAAFDEGGAKGMLMNNLPVGPKGQVIFDSGEPADNLISESEDADLPPGEDTFPKVYDVSKWLPTSPVSPDETICGSFLRFFRAKKQLTENGTSMSQDSCASTQITGLSQDSAPTSAMESDDNGIGCDFDYDNSDLQNAGELGVFSSADDAQDTFDPNDDDDVNMLGPAEVQPSRLSLESNMSIAVAAQRGRLDLVEAGVVLQVESEYAFFDSSTLSGWAGPRHWRFRAVEASSTETSKMGSKHDRKSAKRPRGKTAMLLDFSSQAPEIDFAAEFKPGKSETANQLSSSVLDSFSEKKVTLPEDLHFSVQSLVSLFLKPKTFVKVKGTVVEKQAPEQTNGNNAWYDFDNDCDNENFCPADPEEMFDTVKDLVGDHEGNFESSDVGFNLIDEPTRVEKIDINYAKVAKKVDVRQLKSSLWSKLCGGDAESINEVNSAESSTANVNDAEIPSPARNTEMVEDAGDVRKGASQRLQTIVSDMASIVPPTALPDVSLPYIFICLLHLANEKTLNISQTGDGSLQDLVITTGDTDRNEAD